MIVSVIIPCFNEEEVIEETYRRLSSVMSATPHEYELLFINDGSRDKTLSLLEAFAAKDSMVKILSFSRNFGHQCAVTAGLNHCNGDVGVIIDADLQDPPEIVPEMINQMIAQQANSVYGVRKKREGEGWFKLVTAKMFYRLLNRMSEVKFPVDTGDFRIVDKKIIQQFNQLKETNKYIRGLFSWMGFKQIPFHYEREARFAGETKYPFRKMLKFAMIGLFYFSKKPLNIATTLGFSSVVIGLLYALYVLIIKIFSLGHPVTGWTSTIILIVFFGGVQLLTIGILGKYIGNLFDEVKNRPEYIVDKKINF